MKSTVANGARGPNPRFTELEPKGNAWLLIAASLILTVIFFGRVVITHSKTFIAEHDSVHLYFPWMTKLARDWGSFHPPLWDFTGNAGIPFPSEICNGTFYPVNIAYLSLTGQPTIQTLDWLIVLHFAFGMAGMSLFLRQRGLDPVCSILGGAVFSWIGAVGSRAFGQQMIFESMTFLPWTLLCFHRGIVSRPPVWRNVQFYLSGIFLACSLLCGHPSPFIHNSLMIAAYAVLLILEHNGPDTRKHFAGRAAVALAGIALVAASLSFIQLASSLEYFSKAYRWVGLPEPVRALDTVPFAAYNLYKLHWSEFRSLFDAHQLILDGGTLHLTLTVLVLAGFGLVHKSRWRWFAAILIAFSFLVALGDSTPLGKIFYHTPLLNKVREPVRILYLYQFCMAGLAAYGLSFAIQRLANWRACHIVAPILIFGIFLAEAYHQSSIFFLASHQSINPESVLKRTPLIAFLENEHKKQGGLYRVIARPQDLIPPNSGLVFGFNNTITYRSGFLVSFFDYLSMDWSLSSAQHDELGIRYLITDDADPETLGLPRVFSWDGKGVLERHGAKPIVRLENAPAGSAIGEVTWKPNSLHVILESLGTDRLIFAENYFRGWQVTVNGTRQRIQREGIFMAVPVPAGHSIVDWKYRPYWYPVGISLWLLTGALMMIAKFLNRKRTPVKNGS
jgi:hypothetical protein